MPWDAPSVPPRGHDDATSPAPAPKPVGPTAARSSRRGVLAIAVAVIVSATAGLVVVRPWSNSDHTTSHQTTVWQAITSDFAADGRLTATASLQAFAYVYGVQVPGVQIPSGGHGDDRPTSGSGVVRWVRGRWDELTAAQQAAVNATLAPRPADVVIDVDLDAPAPSRLRASGLSATNPANDTRALADEDACAAGSSTIARAVCSDVVADIPRIGAHLGMRTIRVDNPCLDPVCARAVLSKVTIRLTDVQLDDNVYAATFTAENSLSYSPCNIVVYPSAWHGVDAASVGTSALHEILTHEVVHCYQNVIFGSNATAGAMPPWITEGTALWLASDDTHIEEEMVASQWRKGWLGRPSFPLLERTYDAFGWYSLLDEHRWDLWSLLPAAWRAAASSPTSPSEPFIRVLDGDALEIRQAWAPSIVREPSRGAVWETHGFGLPADARNFFPLMRVSSTPIVAELPGRSALLTQVRATEGEIVTVTTSGLAAATDGVLNLASFTDERFCTIGDCTCPTGTRLAGQVVADNDITVPFMLSFSAPAGGSSYAVTSETLEDACGENDPLPAAGAASPGPCGERCAASNGDPHLVTVDGHRYDFQPAGEFVLLRDAATGTEIEARQEPLPGSKVAAINTQVAVMVGDRRVSVAIRDAVLELRVDGQLTQPGTVIDVGPDAHVDLSRSSVEIGLPDGTTVWALGRDRYGIVVEIAPSDALRAGGTGLLGPVAPGGAGLPALPDGTRLPRPADSHEGFIDRNVRLADAWRVDGSTNILDHLDGEGAADGANPYAVAGFPDELAPSGLAELTSAQVAGAMARCDGVTDALLWAQCVYDVALSGDGGFAELYADAQQMIRAGGGATPISTNPVVPTTMPGSTLDGPLAPTIDHITGVSGSALADDGTLYVSVQLPGDTFELVAIDTSTSTIEQRVHTDGSGPVVIAGGAVWLGDATLAGECAVVRFEPTTLAETGRLAAPCWLSGVQIAQLGDAIWFLDVTGVDADATGAHLVRIDPVTLVTGDRIEVSTSNGYVAASRSAIFYGDDEHGTVRFVDDDRRLVQITGLLPGRHIPAADAIWQVSDQTAQRLDGHDAPVQTIDIEGSLIAADDDAIYIEMANGGDERAQLWAYPLDGGTPVVVTTAPTIGTGAETRVLGYAAAAAPPITAPGVLVAIWVAYPTTGGGDAAMFVQAVSTVTPKR